MPYKNIMTKAGVPENVFREMQETYEKISLLTDSLAETEFTELHDEQELEFETGMLKVLHATFLSGF